jgi:hypothetical protein
MVSAADLVQVLGAATLTGAAGAMLGAGIGTLIRNTGGAATGTIVLLFILPPLAVRMVNEAARWVPSTLANVVSGVDTTMGIGVAIAAVLIWAMVPAALGLAAAIRRDVV